MMSTLTESILATAETLPEGGLLSPKEFLHLASRSAVDKTLSRLTKDGHLLRVGRGSYTRPVVGRFGARPPSMDTVIDAIEAVSGHTVVNNGAAEANALGLTTQVPTRDVLLTSGPPRMLRLGERVIEIKHGNRWQSVLGKRRAGQVIRALGWLGPEASQATLRRLWKQLSPEDWQDLLSTRRMMPAWMARAVSEALPG
ncbi:DUF6088 family protein [Aquabacterium sp.]|uniref:DUF6088 family protein n=1 Tax=Aquabacterium sp. TaxID=1872578 RepID=UPI003B73F07D